MRMERKNHFTAFTRIIPVTVYTAFLYTIESVGKRPSVEMVNVQGEKCYSRKVRLWNVGKAVLCPEQPCLYEMPHHQ